MQNYQIFGKLPPPLIFKQQRDEMISSKNCKNNILNNMVLSNQIWYFDCFAGKKYEVWQEFGLSFHWFPRHHADDTCHQPLRRQYSWQHWYVHLYIYLTINSHIFAKDFNSLELKISNFPKPSLCQTIEIDWSWKCNLPSKITFW